MTTRSVDHPDADDVGPLLHELVGKLPEKYRAPIVLCYFEGLTHEAVVRAAWVADRHRPGATGAGAGFASVAADSPRPGTSDRGLGDGSRAAAGFSERRAAGPGPQRRSGPRSSLRPRRGSRPGRSRPQRVHWRKERWSRCA